MRIRILTVSRKQPAWVTDAFSEYAKRMPGKMSPQLVEIAPADRQRANTEKALDGALTVEANRLRDQLHASDRVIALDEKGTSVTTRQLSDKLSGWMMQGQNLAFVIGGADGLHNEFKREADERLSLSALTLPHGMVRIVLAEALYRAWSLMQNHPYHRG